MSHTPPTPRAVEKVMLIWTDSKGTEHFTEAAALAAEQQYIREGIAAILNNHVAEYQGGISHRLEAQLIDELLTHFVIYPKATP